MECLECGQTYSTDSMATAKQCSGCARIESLRAENAALREALESLVGPGAMSAFFSGQRGAFAQQTEGEG